VSVPAGASAASAGAPGVPAVEKEFGPER
jgi:hypothetical protein